ncbi:MAG: hypothetical protein ACYC1U_01060 [Candidatus Aquicultorales bacterium]
MNKDKMAPIALIIGLVGIAVAVVMLIGNQSNTPTAQTTQTPQNQTGTTGTTGGGTATQPGTQEPAVTGPDTVVPEGTALGAYVQKYYDAIIAKDYKTAYEMQPAVDKAKYDAATFAQNQQGYGITQAKVGAVEESGDTAVVKATTRLTAFEGDWVKAWTFKKKDGKWIVDSALSAPAQ